MGPTLSIPRTVFVNIPTFTNLRPLPQTPTSDISRVGDPPQPKGMLKPFLQTQKTHVDPDCGQVNSITPEIKSVIPLQLDMAHHQATITDKLSAHLLINFNPSFVDSGNQLSHALGCPANDIRPYQHGVRKGRPQAEKVPLDITDKFTGRTKS